ncbi:hypothetical protein DXG01_000583 [Tephrocybe rancida]|nr:hypothetical protein DXG01_000583 [Tephrocybe rancida]
MLSRSAARAEPVPRQPSFAWANPYHAAYLMRRPSPFIRYRLLLLRYTFMRELDVHISELPRRMKEALKSATSGPFLVNLPKDVTAAILLTLLPYTITPPSARLPMNPLQSLKGHSLIMEAAALINQAQRPVVCADNGALASTREAPSSRRHPRLGAFGETDDRSLYMLGLHGSAYANFVMQEADVIIALGALFDDRFVGKVDAFAPTAKVATVHGRGA